MKTGIYAGSFDPPTFGHLWVIEAARKIFDNLYVLIGRHPGKTPLFSTKERRLLLQECACEGVQVEIMEGEIADFVDEAMLSDVTLVRGIRGSADMEYEAHIAEYQRTNGFETSFFVPPNHLSELSSSKVKDLARVGEWHVVEGCVPSLVCECLKVKLAANPQPMTIRYDEADLLRQSFDKLEDTGFLSLPKTVTGEQVRKMLDPFPVDVVASEVYRLETIWIDDVEPTGTRYIKRSCSLGPIIVDFNEQLPDLGSVIVIEGKHRWLDARKRGEKTIRAWVGEKASHFWRANGRASGN